MNLSRVSANAQVTIPVEISKGLNPAEDDKTLFPRRGNGGLAIGDAQKAFGGAARDFGVYSEDDVQRLVDETRYGGGKEADYIGTPSQQGGTEELSWELPDRR